MRCTTNQTFNVQKPSSNAAPDVDYGTVSGALRYLLLGSNNTQDIRLYLYSDATLSTVIANSTDITPSGIIDSTPE